jgi:hypothetical protein
VQDDGNLVIYGPFAALWTSGTNEAQPSTPPPAPPAPPAAPPPSAPPSIGSCGVLGVDGVLAPDTWVTSCDGRFSLVHQSDGNVVVMNRVRIVYLDGRKPTEPDIIVRTYNGESIGTWEGDTLVVDTIGFRGDHHWMDQGGVAIPAGEQLHIVERIRLINDKKQLEIEYTMTDPEYWEGEWKSTKRFNRVNDEDIQEVSCLPDLNEHLQSTTSKTQVR